MNGVCRKQSGRTLLPGRLPAGRSRRFLFACAHAHRVRGFCSSTFCHSCATGAIKPSAPNTSGDRRTAAPFRRQPRPTNRVTRNLNRSPLLSLGEQHPRELSTLPRRAEFCARSVCGRAGRALHRIASHRIASHRIASLRPDRRSSIAARAFSRGSAQVDAHIRAGCQSKARSSVSCSVDGCRKRELVPVR